MKKPVRTLLVFLAFFFFGFYKSALPPRLKPFTADDKRPLPWGAFYAPHSAMLTYGMTGLVTGQLSSPAEILDVLGQAEEGGYSVIATLGRNTSCTGPHWLDGSQARLNSAYSYFHGVLSFSESQKSQLQHYIDNGTLRAFRIYDEVHDAHCGGVSMPLSHCSVDEDYKIFMESRNAIVMEPGRDGSPGFGDLLYRLMQDLPAGVAIGSTSAPSYMLMVAERINQLRLANGQGPLPDKSILASDAPPRAIRNGGHPDVVRAWFECSTHNYPGSEVLYFLGNITTSSSSTNYDFFADYIAMCSVNGLDFRASWSWYDQTGSGSFQSRIEDLRDGGVSNGQNTISLQDLQAACGRYQSSSKEAVIGAFGLRR